MLAKLFILVVLPLLSILVVWGLFCLLYREAMSIDDLWVRNQIFKIYAGIAAIFAGANF